MASLSVLVPLLRPRLRRPLCSAVRRRLDAAVVGHEDAKEALLLGLVAKEHVLLCGPSGSAKSLLATEFAFAAGKAPCVLQLHRDVRAEDLTSSGGVLTSTQDGDGQRLSYSARPGGLLTADVCVLDDVSRAPQEALGALFRALTHQEASSGRLRTAVATCLDATSGEEPMDPALLDRFPLQLQLTGALYGQRWEEAGGIMTSARAAAAADASELDAGVELAAARAGVPREVRRLLLRVVQRLREECSQGSLLSDRTFLVKAVRLLRAKAALEGRTACQASDLFVLRFLTTFRVPPEVHARIEEIIRQVIASAEEQRSERPDWSVPPQDGPDAEEGKPAPNAAGLDRDGEGENDEESEESSERSEGKEGAASGSGNAGSESEAGEATEGQQNGAGKDPKWLENDAVTTSESSGQSVAKNSGEEGAAGDLEMPSDALVANMGNLDVDLVSVENIELLLSGVVGSIDKGREELEVHPAGSPRRYKTWDVRDTGDFTEIDPFEMHRWVGSPSPALLPRARERLKRSRGGLVAMLRDVSMSMAGVNATWSSRVTLGLLEACRERQMSFGYIEFNHCSRKFRALDGAFFSQDYASLGSLAMRLQCNGWTNYSKPLAEVLQEFAARSGGRPLRQQAHVLLLTDGVPTHGDPEAREERLLARRLGVVIHTVYLGWPQGYPRALEALSGATGGRQFAAFYQPERRDEPREGVSAPRPPRERRTYGVGLDSGFIRVVER